MTLSDVTRGVLGSWLGEPADGASNESLAASAAGPRLPHRRAAAHGAFDGPWAELRAPILTSFQDGGVVQEGHYFTADEMADQEGKVPCNFKAMMLGNQVDDWPGDKSTNAYKYRYDLKASEVTTYWPGKMADGECDNVTDVGSKCWLTSRLLNDHQCRDDSHCLHIAMPQGETSATFTCPTWVKKDGKRCQLPYGWQACPSKFVNQREDSGVPQELERASTRSCGVQPSGKVLVGSWVYGLDKSTWSVRLNPEGKLQIQLDNNKTHAVLNQDQDDWYVGDLVNADTELKDGRQLRVRLNENGQAELQVKHTPKQSWKKDDIRLSYRNVPTFGGNGKGQSCVFPFEHNGQKYYSCTKETNGDVQNDTPWCMVSSDPPPHGRWGHCREEVPRQPSFTVGTHSGSATPGNCSFPFNYKGKKRESCISDDESSPWCKTDKLGNWGFCNAKVPEEATKHHPIKTHGGSSKEAQTCHFPFKYKGKVYHRCISEGEKAPWCMTAGSGGAWGFCNAESPVQLQRDEVPTKAEAELPSDKQAQADHCTGTTRKITNPNMIMNLQKNEWYRCSPEYVCEAFPIRAIKAEGSKCGGHTCPKDEQCFVHYVDSKTSTYECVPTRHVYVVSPGDEAVYGHASEGVVAPEAAGDQPLPGASKGTVPLMLGVLRPAPPLPPRTGRPGRPAVVDGACRPRRPGRGTAGPGARRRFDGFL